MFLRVHQVNVNHSPAAHRDSLMSAEEFHCDFLCIQDPYLADGTPIGDSSNSSIFSSNRLTNLYFQPHDNIDLLINEILHLGLNNSYDLLVGDFNARSQVWGYGFEDHRGRVISDFLVTNNFSICNDVDLGPTFVTNTGQGFPDLTLISVSCQSLLDSWSILNIDSLGDHKHVCVRLAGDFKPSDDFIFKTRYSTKKFLYIFQKKFDYLYNLYNSIQSVDEVDYFYNMFIQVAYADDLALILYAKSRKNLELIVNSSLDLLCDKLSDLNLRVASEKTLAVVFRGTQNKNKQKRELATLKRPPIFKIQNGTIRTVDSLKYLGIIIDNRFNWSEHISFLRSKMLNLIKNFVSVSGPNWGVGVSLLKHWNLSVIQPSILYRSAVWGGSFTVKHINSLFSIQRLALLKISKSYRTCPTNALNVFLGIPPLHVVANGLYIKFQIWNLRMNGFDFIDINNLDKYIEINNTELKYRILDFPTTIDNSDFEVYADGSGIDGNIGASVCIFNNNNLVNVFKFKLSNFNSVFQAELAAINFAAGWALDNNVRVNIFTDSLSSIEALKKSNSKSKYLCDIKNNMFNAIGSVGLSWVKAHAGIPGNELADQYANYSLWHGPFPAYLHRFNILNSPNCICGGLGDPDHFAFDCSLTTLPGFCIVFGMKNKCCFRWAGVCLLSSGGWSGSLSPAALVMSYTLTGRLVAMGWVASNGSNFIRIVAIVEA
ncbi:hypothetical protein AVEN_100098-1 [Araneus ventricosus]|uniref:RNase H type-1 domain-containing protein n=1 Tax=Araneus ventricosus TaxID=182803 RepID=A0A4Y2QXI3_ARAVE|nr:hypothetical protein AVEN_100098-1 [Araneus ventricosus]